jgi:hypothetical protein
MPKSVPVELRLGLRKAEKAADGLTELCFARLTLVELEKIVTKKQLAIAASEFLVKVVEESN